MSNPITGVAESHDFLTDYLYAVRALLHDGAAIYFSDNDLNHYINEARRHVCVDTGCLRQLLNVTFPANQSQFFFGGVYLLTDVATPAGGVAPYKLVSGGGGVGTANTSTVPMTIAVTTPGTYTRPPVISIDSDGINVSASATAVLGPASAPTTIHLFSTASTDALNSSLLFTSAQIEGSIVQIAAGLTGWGLIGTSTGVTPPAFAFSAAAPTPNGYGFLATPSGGGAVLVPNKLYAINLDTLTLYVVASDLNLTGDLHLRFWRYDSNLSTYSLFTEVNKPALSLPANAPVTLTSWNVVSQQQVFLGPNDWLFVDCVLNVTSNTAAGPTPTIGFSGSPMLLDLEYSGGGQPIIEIDVNSDAGLYSQAAVVPAVNIIPAGIPAQVSNNAGLLQLDSQGAGLCSGVFIEDAAGTLTPVSAGAASIMPCNIAAVDNCTLLWNSQRIALRNLAFTDFSAALRGWTQYQNVPVAYSVYAESLWIGPPANQAYGYELDCITYPARLMDYLTVGQIADAAAIGAVKYYAAYLAKMGQQEEQAASAFYQLYQAEVRWAANRYTKYLSRTYQDNANLE